MKDSYTIIPILPDASVIKDVAIVGVPSVFDAKPSEDLIATGWERATKRMSEHNWSFYDGPLLRFEGMEEIEGNIRIYASHANTYRHVVGLRAHDPETFSHLQPHERPNVLSAINIITTNDGKFLMRWRNSGDWNESYELSGGFVRTHEPSFLHSAQQRLTSDLLISPREITKQTLLTVLHLPHILETMAVFSVHLNLTAEEIVSQDHRYIKILHIPQTKEAWEETKNQLEKNDPSHLHPPSKTILDTMFESFHHLLH